jgi:hypothetical protein
MPDFTMIFENMVKSHTELGDSFFCIWKDIYALKTADNQSAQ